MSETLPSQHARWFSGDALWGLSRIESESVDTVVTSVPYWGLRRYLSEEASARAESFGAYEIGTEDFEAYQRMLEAVFTETLRVVKPGGVLWLNVGDTYSGSGGAGGDYLSGSKRGRRYRQAKSPYPARTLMLTGPRLAISLVDAGWLVRSEVTWSKGFSRGECASHVRRPTPASEKLYMMEKPGGRPTWNEDVTIGDVWEIPSERKGSGGHQAAFPIELAARAVTLTTDPGGVVLDPFAGSATTLVAGLDAGCSVIGIDLDPDMVSVATDRIAPVALDVEFQTPDQQEAAA